MNTGSLAPKSRDLADSSPAPQSRVEREFELLRRLDGAGPGEQWLARRTRDRQQALVRFVPREAVAHTFERDLLGALRLPPHPNLAPLLALDHTEDRLVFSVAHVAGDDLASLVQQTGPMPPDAAADCLRQALAGLKHAHEHRLAHGALTPADLILDYDGVLRIANVGCAGACDDFAVSATQDLRALGVVLHWLLCGEPPAHPEGNGHNGNGRPAERRLPAEADLHPPLTKLLQRLLAAGEPHGFASAGEALAWMNDPDALTASAPAQLCACGQHDSDSCAPVNKIAETVSPIETAAARPDDALSGSDELAHRSKVWLYGAVAITLALLLAGAGYLVWR
jgi:serine/threonine protein kinase